MKKFEDATEVRQFLKSKGFKKVRVRYQNNPFGGDGKFVVAPTDLPEGVSIVTSSEPRKPTRWASDDDGKTAGMIVELQEALAGTNTIVVAR